MSDPTPAPFVWTPDPAELIQSLGVSAMSAEWLREQPGRFEVVGGSSRLGHGSDASHIVNRPDLVAGTALWFDRQLDALLVRDALRHLGHAAELLFDVLSTDADADDVPFVVVSSVSFEVWAGGTL